MTSLNADGTYDVFYTVSQDGDVIHSLSGIPSNVDAYFVMGPWKTPFHSGENLDLPMIACGSGMPVTGNKLCPDIMYLRSLCLLLKKIPCDKLHYYQTLELDAVFIYMDTDPRNLLMVSDMNKWFKAREVAQFEYSDMLVTDPSLFLRAQKTF